MTASSPMPAAQAIVSAMCDSTASSGSSAAAMPPWASYVFDCRTAPLVMASTWASSAAAMAARSPAAPVPITRTSVKMCPMSRVSRLSRYRRCR